MDLSNLARLIKEKNCSIFLGAGFSMDSGGPGGQRLLNEIKTYFSESETRDSFKYLQEIIGIDSDKRKEVEKFIRKYLSRIEYNKNQKYLLSIPWKSVLTTNYDHVPDMISVSLDGNREIQEKDPITFNIYFNYTGPQARNVIKRF